MEIALSACIIGVLLAITSPFFLSYREQARVVVAVNEIKTVEAEVLNYAVINGEFPDTLGQIGFGKLRDPWGNAYQYLRIDEGEIKGKGQPRKDDLMVPANSDFDLYSMGLDGVSVAPFTDDLSKDDIVRAFNGAYVGKVADM